MIGIAWLQQILNKIGANDDAASMSDTLFAGQQSIYDALSDVGLSDKGKSLLGIGAFPGFQDFFDTIADEVNPNSTYWSVIENTGTVQSRNVTASAPGYIVCSSGITNGQDAIAYTQGKKLISRKNGVTTVHFKMYGKFDWIAEATGVSCGVGLVENDLIPSDTSDLIGAGNEVASIVVKDSTPYAYTSDGNTAESTDLSSYISDDMLFTLEIRITNSNVKFYIDGTLRATHSTNVPISIWQLMLGATCVNSATERVFAQYVQLWAE